MVGVFQYPEKEDNMSLKFKQNPDGSWTGYSEEQQEKSAAPKKPGRKKKTETEQESIVETEEN